MTRKQRRMWLRLQPSDWLLACAENEGGRAALCMQGYANEETAFYFAEQAGRYANAWMERQQAVAELDVHAGEK
jgi:hypothetical protein